jgi:hypothetical protein
MMKTLNVVWLKVEFKVEVEAEADLVGFEMARHTKSVSIRAFFVLSS